MHHKIDGKVKMVDSSIFIARKLLETMLSHATFVYPQECCGLLVGISEGGGKVKKVTSVIPVENVAQKNERSHRYVVDLKKYIDVEMNAEESNNEVIGIFHSHPESPAQPSKYDKDFAWPDLSYVIVEVRERKPVRTSSWTLSEDKSSFVEEKLIIEKKL